MNYDVEDIIVVKQLLSKSIKNTHYDYINKLIDKNVSDCNLLYTQVCYLIKLFLLYDCDLNSNYPNQKSNYIFNENFIRFCFRLIKNSDTIDIKKYDTNSIHFKLYNFYIKFNSDSNKEFKFTCPDNLNSISHITDTLSRDIQTNITNNIIINYFKYVKEYIRINLKLEFDNIKIDNKIVLNVFNDLISNTFNSNSTFHNWIIKHKQLIIPNIKNNINIKSINDGIKNHYKIFTPFIKKYIKTNEMLNFIIKNNKEIKINKLFELILLDITNETFNSDVKYHDWIKENKILIINEFNKINCIDLEKELESEPYQFIQYMLFINKNLEKNKSKKKYQIIPLRTNLTPKFIPINTDSLVDLLDSPYLLDKIKNYYHNDSKKGLILFETYFDFTSKYIINTVKKGYLFSGLISTNGYEINYYYYSKSYYEKKENFHNKGKEEKKKIKEATKELGTDEYNDFITMNKKNKEENKKNKSIKLKEENKIKKDKQKNDEKKKLDEIKTQIESLNSDYEKNYNLLVNSHYESLNTEFNTIDKTNPECKNQMKLILEKLNNKLSSDKAYLKHCFDRDYLSLINDLDNNIEMEYKKLINNDEENDKLIDKIRIKILNKKKELKKLNKELNSSDKKIKNKKLNKKITSNKKLKIKIARLIQKIRLKTNELNYETKDKSLTSDHIKKITNKLVELIKKLYDMKKMNLLNEYLNKITNNDIKNLDKKILDKSTTNIKSIFDLCLIELSKDLSEIKKEILNGECEKIKTNNINIKKETEENKQSHLEVKNELISNSNELNKLLKIKLNNENKFINLFKTKSNENMQIDLLSKKSMEIIDKMNWVVIDPGMNSLLTMMSKDGNKSYSYSKEHHINRTNRKKYKKKIELIKKEKIKKLEEELSKSDERLKTSNDYETFKLYFNKKMKHHNLICKLYNDSKLNKLKWHMFINEKRSESLLVNEIKKKYELELNSKSLKNQIVLILGDWSMNKKGIKSESVPNKRYERILKKNFLVLKINEFRTSIIHNKREKRCENEKKKYEGKKTNIKSVYSLERLKEKNEARYEKAIKEKKIHKILICKTNEKLNEYVNRDKNSVKNMKKIVLSYIKTNHKPKTFVLGTKICNDTLCVM